MVYDVPGYSGTAHQQISADILIAISNWVDNISANLGTAPTHLGTSQSVAIMTRSMRAKPASPVLLTEQQMLEEPMSVDEPVSSENPILEDTRMSDIPVPMVTQDDPMTLDEPVFPERPVPDWARKFMSYLADGTLPSEEVEAREVVRAKAFTIINKELYKRSVASI